MNKLIFQKKKKEEFKNQNNPEICDFYVVWLSIKINIFFNEV